MNCKTEASHGLNTQSVDHQDRPLALFSEGERRIHDAVTYWRGQLDIIAQMHKAAPSQSVKALDEEGDEYSLIWGKHDIRAEKFSAVYEEYERACFEADKLKFNSSRRKL